MRSIVRFVLSHTVLVNLGFFFLMAVGVYATFFSSVERYPNVNMAQVHITTVYPGASPAEVEALVTREIEDALDDMESVEFIRSTSYRDRSSVLVKLIDDSDYQRGYDEIRFRVLNILDELPPEVDPPLFNFIDVNDWQPVVTVNLVGERSNRALSLMAKELKISLLRIPGVKEVLLRGELKREFHVALDPLRLRRFGVTFAQVSEALKQANLAVPAGGLTAPGGEFLIRADERFRSRQQVMQTIVRTDQDGSHLRVSDLARWAGLNYRDAFLYSSVNGNDCVRLDVVKTEQGNALTILEEVRALVNDSRSLMQREGVEIVLTRDSTLRIKEAMRTLGMNLLVGVGLVVLLIWYFMGFRNAAITTVGIPFSFLFTMVLMYVTGHSLNEITLFSFVLVSGIIVDDAIVVVENIYRHRQQGEPLVQAVVEGTSEVMVPVISATATTMSAFLPMLIMTGSTGEFFALVPKAVCFALAASIIECALVLPLHYKDYGPRGPLKAINVAQIEYEDDNRVLAGLRVVFGRSLGWCLRHKFSTLALLALVFLASLGVAGVSFSGMMPLIQVKFFPDIYPLYYVELEGPTGTPLEEVNRRVKEISRLVMKDGPGMAESAVAYAGLYIDEDYRPVYGLNVGMVGVNLPEKNKRRFADYPVNDPKKHLESMRERLKPFASGGFTIRIRPEKDGPPAGKDFNVRVVGTNHQAVEALAGRLMKYLTGKPELAGGLTDLASDLGSPTRVYRFKVLSEKAAEYKLKPAQVVGLAGSVVNGQNVGKFRLQDEDVDLKLMIAPESLRVPEDVLQVPVVDFPAGPLKIGDLCRLVTYLEPSTLHRYQGARAVTITANLHSKARMSITSLVREVKDFHRRVAALYPGANLVFAGEYESTRKSYTSLFYAFLIAMGVMYLILATQFRSYLQPLIILTSVAFALIGVVFGKLVTQTIFTINSFIATVGVAGVVVNDALVLIDFINKRYRTGLSRREAVVQATHMRLRPILLTTLTTSLGLLPMAVGFPEYSLVWGTMASTFVTGLCTATGLTIVAVPVLWEMVEKIRERCGGGVLRDTPLGTELEGF